MFKIKKFCLLIVSLLSLVAFTGCEKVQETGKYHEGTYFGYDEYESYGTKYVTSAVVYVNENGVIKSVFIDSTYNKDGINSPKKTLGDAYGMKETSANIGVIPGGAEGYEQVSKIEDKVISEQSLDWVKWSDEAETKLDVDTISGVTISSDSYIRALSNAFDKMK